MITRFFTIVLPFLLLACARTPNMKPPLNNPSDDATIKLAKAATDISHTMREVARVEKIIYQPPKEKTLKIPSTHNLQARATVDWSGPIQELTARIAKAAHYRMNVMGTEPPIPILINLSTRDESLAELLRDIDYQAGQRASIYVNPKTQVVELRYAKFYS